MTFFRFFFSSCLVVKKCLVGVKGPGIILFGTLDMYIAF